MSSRAREKRGKYGTKRKEGFPKSPGKNSTPAAGRHWRHLQEQSWCVSGAGERDTR